MRGQRGGEEGVEVGRGEAGGRSYTGGRQEAGVTPSTSESASALPPGWNLKISENWTGVYIGEAWNLKYK